MTDPVNSTSNPFGNKFRDSMNRWRTQSLFLESSWGSSSPDKPIYTMKPDDLPSSALYPEGLPSFAKRYLALEDPTEYRAATELLGGWEHWTILCESKWFSDYILPLREELEIRLRSKGQGMLLKIMTSDNRNALAAAKYFADSGFKPKKVGRPSNAQVEAEAKKQAEVQRRVQGDAKRLGLVVNND